MFLLFFGFTGPKQTEVRVAVVPSFGEECFGHRSQTQKYAHPEEEHGVNPPVVGLRLRGPPVSRNQRLIPTAMFFFLFFFFFFLKSTFAGWFKGKPNDKLSF